MKLVSKIFMILAIIFSAISIVICIIFGIIMLATIPMLPPPVEGEVSPERLAVLVAGISFFIGSIGAVIPIVINAIGLKQLEKAKANKDVLVISILLIVLGGNIISGILMLCMKDEDFF